MNKEDLLKHYKGLKEEAISFLDNFKNNGSTSDNKKESRIKESIYQYTCFIESLNQLSLAVEEVDKWISPEAVLDFIQKEHEFPVPGVVASDESNDHTYKDRIILTDAGFYWQSDDEGNHPMDSKDIIQMYKNSRTSAPKQETKLQVCSECGKLNMLDGCPDCENDKNAKQDKPQ